MWTLPSPITYLSAGSALVLIFRLLSKLIGVECPRRRDKITLTTLLANATGAAFVFQVQRVATLRTEHLCPLSGASLEASEPRLLFGVHQVDGSHGQLRKTLRATNRAPQRSRVANIHPPAAPQPGARRDHSAPTYRSADASTHHTNRPSGA